VNPKAWLAQFLLIYGLALAAVLGIRALCGCSAQATPDPCIGRLAEQRRQLDEDWLYILIETTKDCSEWDVSRPGGWGP
jgi:hypothetical protein